MAEFRIKATSAETGADYFISQMADSSDAAERLASADGHVVEKGSAILISGGPARRVKSKTAGCTALGFILFAVGALTLLWSVLMPTTVPTEGLLGSVHNIGLLNDRALNATVGGALFIAGTAFLCAGAIGAQIRAAAR